MLFSALCLFAATFCRAQQDPVHWSYRIADTAAGKEVRLVASIDNGWHIYAQVQPPAAISVPTAIVFSANPLVEFTSPLKEKGRKEIYSDPNSGITQYQYTDSVVYIRPFRMRGQAKSSVTGTITYQACTSEMCLPAKTIPFTIALP